MNREWEYYNHALIPTTAPHVAPDTSWMKDQKKWRELAGGKYPLFARWTTDFDCQEETEWWYCIKDDKLDLSKLNSKKRRMVNLGLRYIDVKIISPCEYAAQLAEVNLAARIGYGEKIDLEKERASLIEEFSSGDVGSDECRIEVTGAFLKENGKLVGYGIYEIFEDWVSQSVMKSDPQYHKYHTNAALAYFCAERYLGEKFNIKYISIGARNISHPTNYYEYLMTYFGYRKAYCRLHVKYRVPTLIAVKILFAFRKLICKNESNVLIHNIASVMRLEEIRRTFTLKS